MAYNSNLDLYHLTPDLLDRANLLNVLESRCIKVPKMITMSREKLVAIYKQVIAPQPQRTITRKRKHLNTSHAPVINLHASAANIGSNKFQPLDRLKPPPDAINYERKKIRLSSSCSQQSNSGTNLDHIIIKDRTKKDKPMDNTTKDVQSGVEMVVKDRFKEITLSEKKTKKVKKTSLDQTGDMEMVVVPKVEKPRIKLKRSSSISSEKRDSTETDIETNNKRKKKKIIF